jgi:hypothetical protein
MLQPSPHNASPTVRVQQSTPTPPEQSQQMLAQQSPFMGGSWNDFNNGAYLSALPKAFKDQRIHKRGSSGSSVASAGGPPSPLSHNTLYPHIATADSYPTYNDFDFPTPQTAKSLPANDMSGMYNRPNPYGAVDMRRIQSSGGDDRASYTISAPQSVSTMSHNSPATPHTNYETDYDDSKNVYGEINLDDDLAQYLQIDSGYPSAAYQQSLQDVFPDQQFGYQHQAVQRLTPQLQRPSMIAERLQAAQQDHLRTNSPTSNPRDKSPFRHNSPYNMPVQQQRQQQPPILQKARTSISPKELMLDEHDIDESNATPLFHNQSQQMYTSPRNPSNLSNYYTPAFNTEPSIQIPQQYPFVGQQSRGDSASGLPDATPDFPAHMISMESTAEEGQSMPSSQQSIHESRAQPQQTPHSIQRPVDTSSDAGTYSCTYHGCSQRFDTPAKLQKHKREGHRQVSPNSGSASPSLALRNSQAGPHRCDRINPSTGKPCNSIFSRPYDLTRHEDTIHNARKQKVRCHLCTEEKTFSRNDALTRHMRVVHPDVDWVGKQKRKSHK